ncbi:MAG TPA: ATP cone domain-containing protein [archaeon]|nr:ATP cone domain-containing protein [archaeon]
MASEEKPIEEIVEKIAKECEESGASKWLILKIVKELNALENKDPEKMRLAALEILRQNDQKSASVFASFQRMNVRNSKQEIEPFDRGNIIKSLLKETRVARGVAEKIGREVEDKINELQISYITTALIRELVNVKLLEYGHESIRNQYARAGLPVFEIEQKTLAQPYAGNKEMLTEYNLLKVIPKEISDLHMSSDIFIANIEDFSTKPCAFAVRMEKQKNLQKTVFECIKKANSMQKFFSWGINIAEANLALAALAEKTTPEEAADFFSEALECSLPQKPSGNIALNLFVPENTEYEIDNETLIVTANKLLEKIKSRSIEIQPVFLIDTKYKINLLNKKYCSKISFVNCKKNYLLPFNGIPAKNGILCFTAINLPKQALGNFQEEFLKKTLVLAEKAKQLSELKKSELAKRNYLKEAGIETEKMSPVLGLFAVVQACKIVLPNEPQKSVFELCQKTILGMKKILGEEWLFVELKNPLGMKRFEAQNKKQFNVDSKSDDFRQLMKAGLQKSFFFQGEAKSRAAFNKLMDENIAWINFKK